MRVASRAPVSSRSLRLALFPFLFAKCAGLPQYGRAPAAEAIAPTRAAAICSAGSSSAAMTGDGGSGKYTYPWPRPSLTVDAIIVACSIPRRWVPPQPSPLGAGGPHPSPGSPGGETLGTEAQLLLIQRKNDPFAGSWALPGGFVDENEPLDKAAARELQEETSVDPASVLLTQVGAFGDPGRDPRGWCITVAYAALVPSTELGVKAADDAQAAQWFDIQQLPRLAFDHKLVVRTAFRHLAGQEQVQQQAGLGEQLRAAAEALEGPWQQQ